MKRNWMCCILEKFNIDLTLYNHHPWKCVHHVPFDINGTERFEISYSGNEWAKRIWMDSAMSQNVKDLCVVYEKCLCQLANEHLNTKAFNRIAGHFTCKICGHYDEQKWCRAKKAIEYDNDRQILSVWHQGQHNCTFACKNETYEEKEQKKNILREIVNKNPRVPRVKLIDQGSQF